jgi:chloride channel 3/4/5
MASQRYHFNKERKNSYGSPNTFVRFNKNNSDDDVSPLPLDSDDEVMITPVPFTDDEDTTHQSNHRHLPSPLVETFTASMRQQYTYEPVIKPEPKYYEDFHTIDWVRDKTKDHLRHKNLVKYRNLTITGFFNRYLDAVSGWLLVLLVGVASGLFAGIIDVAAVWTSDLKMGICPASSYYDKEHCCWLSNQTNTENSDDCGFWQNWSAKASLNVNSAAADYAFNYFVYVLYSVVLAGLAGLFVVVLAPYAAGSGIPEVKTILSGFIIRGYLGAWTLIVKCAGMVLAVGAGLSLGKEGPLVHVACCCGNLFTR